MTEEVKPLDELTLLKQRATLLGINFSNNIGLETLKARIEEATREPEPEKELTVQDLRQQLRAEHLALVRIRITNMNPAKKDLPGEIITIANGVIGTVKHFVPFQGTAAEVGWYVPKIILNELQERKFVVQEKIADDKGRDRMVSRERKEFAIEILPHLTEEELKKLAQDQRVADRI